MLHRPGSGYLLVTGFVVAGAAGGALWTWRERLVAELQPTFGLGPIAWVIGVVTVWPARLVVALLVAMALLLVLSVLRGRNAGGAARRPWFTLWDGALVLAPSAAVAVLLPMAPMARLMAVLVNDRHVVVLASGRAAYQSPNDYGWIGFDPVRRALIACGNGLEHVEVYDLAGDAPQLRRSAAASARAQFCGFDAEREEIIVFNRRSSHLLRIDIGSLVATDSIPLSLPGGEVFVAADPLTNTIVAGAEGSGAPDTAAGTTPGTAVIDRTTGQVLETVNLTPGYLVRHAGGGVVYVDYFNRSPSEVIRFDAAERRVTHRVATDGYLDRMVHEPRRDEVLVASPLRSRVLRFGAGDLTPRGAYRTAFGTRAVAVDTLRDLMLTTNLVRGTLDVHDLSDGRRRARYRLGAWPRSIALDVSRGEAFVSSMGALYRVSYLARLER